MTTGPPSDDELRDAVDVVALQQLQSAYADIVSRKACDELVTVFAAHATVVLNRRTLEPLTRQGPGEIAAFIGQMIAPLDFFEFVVLNHRILLRHQGDVDLATGRVYLSELRRDAASERWNVIYGLYHDRYARADGRWWIVHRHYHTLGRTNADLDVFPFPEGDFS